jgi:flavin-dependent dehydrogenase
MVVRIIIAGAGHGGLVAGILLARQGFDVSLYEQCPRDALGHDWHDDFFLESFDKAGLPQPAASDYSRKQNVVFHSPDMNHVLSTSVPEGQREIQMDRKVLYSHLLALADAAGMKLSFNSHISGPLLRGNNETVCGLVVNGKEVRHGLPASYHVEPDIGLPDVFYTYRAYYQLLPGKPCDPARFNIHFLYGGIRGIAWFRVVDGQADVFFGQVDPLSQDRVDELLLAMRHDYPALGETRTRGGQFVPIPIRRTLARFVGDGYAAVGDAACMTVPLNGSGIHNALVAGKLLAETVTAACTSKTRPTFTARALWPYQLEYYKRIGARMAGIGYIKQYLLALPTSDLDFIIAKHLISEKEIVAASAGDEINIGFKDLLGKLARGLSRLPLLLSLKKADRMKQAVIVASRIPTEYDVDAINRWEAILNRSMSSF